MKWQNDTAWYVNPAYDDVYHPNYNPTFTFPVFSGSAYQSFKVEWGDGVVSSGCSTGVENKLSHLYTQTGVFEVKLLLYSGVNVSGDPDEIFYKKVMNKSLDASFRLSPSGSRRCMEWGGDSVKFILTSENNPPGTEYTILVDSDIEKLPGKSGKKLFTTTWIDGERDSAWIVALEPTGVYGARVGLSLRWAKNGVVLNSTLGQLDMFWAYKSPDLNDIYHFADTVAAGEPLKNFLLCIPADAPLLWLDSAVLALYQYRSASNPQVSPYYKTVHDRLSFNVEYFWTDTTPSKDTRWLPVTGQTEYVDTTEIVSFKKAGFYKMRMEAYNQCSYDIADPTKLLYLDSLWTDSVRDSSTKRYFQVFEQAADKIECRKDSVCVGSPKQVVIVDRNSRRNYDVPPDYKVTVREASKDADYTSFSKLVKIYKNGKVLTGNVYDAGCDSTEILLTLRDTGDYAVELKRECQVCDPITVDFNVYVGDVPTLFALPNTNPIEDTLFAKYNFGLEPNEYVFQRCDSFRYDLQQELWSDRNFTMDSVYFYMRKGRTRQDTILNYAQLFYDFDSVGNVLNSIKVNAHNYCGWGRELDAVFYTRTRPKVELLRDSLVNNDSLCVDFNYDYYLGGVLPEKMKLQAMFSRQSYVDGSMFLEDKMQDVSYVDGKLNVRHPVAGKTYEYFKVINQSMPVCSQVYRDSVYAIPPPDPLIYRDSVGYCASLTELETGKLFASGRNQFLKAGWSWNSGAVVADKFPKFNYTPGGGDDKLSYLLSNSRGCYRKGELLFKPRAVPDLQLKPQGEYCLPDTINDFGDLAIDMSAGMSLYVYHSTQADGNLACKPGKCEPLPLTPFTNDTLDLIYVLKNHRVDTAFMGGCRVADSIGVVLRRPLLEIQKSDTLFYPWNEYDFSSIRGHIDTNDVQASFVWKKLDGNVLAGGPDLYAYKYALSADDKTKNELRFELSGSSVCGKPMTDTLVVVVAHGKLEGYSDTICLAGNYPLAGKLKKSFVNESTLKWAICYPTDPAKQGTLSAPVGASVGYAPYAGAGWSDSVRICVEGETVGIAGYNSRDTIVLKIHQSPNIQALTDTLIAEDREINILKISDRFFKREHVVSYKINQIVTSNNGILMNDSVYLFTGDPLASNGNNYAKAELLVEPLPGCPSVKTEFTFLDLCNADFAIHDPVELCAGDVLASDTLYREIKGFDEYTSLHWTLGGTSPSGSLDGDSSHYTAPLTHGVRKLKLGTSKSYMSYKGTVYNQVLPVEKELEVMVHSEPYLALDHEADTLCRTQDEILIRRLLVSVSPDGYVDSLRLNGRAFIGDQSYPTRALAGGGDTVVFTVNQGRCTKWAVSDTLFLYRLPHMISGEFSIPGVVCAASTSVIDLTGLTLDAGARNVYWRSTGGTVSQTTPPLFVPDAGVKGEASVTLHVEPARGCDNDTLRKEFSIHQLPLLTLRADTVCNVPGLPVEVPVLEEYGSFVTNIRTIDWFLGGNAHSIGTTIGTSSFHYTLTKADSIAGVVELVAQVWANAPCGAEYFYDTVQIALEGAPEIVLPLVDPVLCQGVDADLADLVEVRNASSTSWIKKAGTQGSLSGSVYSPGEYWGNAAFTLNVQGRSGCPQAVKDVSFAVGYAPIPQANVGGLACQADTMIFNTVVRPGVSAVYEWSFGDGSPVVQGTDVRHVYVNDGFFQVRLTGIYGECRRSANLVASVNKKPLAVFNPEPQIVIGKPVTFTSESEPAGVDCKWYFDNTIRLGSACEYVFTGNSGDRKVLLEVTTTEGCRDTVSHTLVAVKKPVADFRLVVDSCRGVVDVINQSERAYAEVDWNFGNEMPHSSDWEPLQQVYRRIYDDTVYQVTMVVKNIAGSDTLVLPVKMVSRLKAKLDVMPASGQCNQSEKELHVLVEGKADTVRVWWGDDHYEQWGGDQGVKLRRHRYVNDTTVVKYFPLVMAAENVCQADTTAPVAVPVAPVAVKARVILDENYQNECYGEERGFLNKSFGFIPAGYRCEWIFENKGNIVTDNRAAVAYRFNEPGEYQVKLRVYDHCNEDADSVFVKVYGNDSLDFAVEGGVHCSGDEVRMTSISKGVAPFGDFRWEFGDGSVASGRDVTRTFSQSGPQEVKLTAVAEGCRSLPVVKTVQVRKSPQPVVDKPVVMRGCQPFTVDFEGRNANGEVVDALWDFKDDAFSNRQIATRTFEKEGVYNVSFRLTTREGCVDSVVVPVTVLPTPQVALTLSDRSFCSEAGNIELTCTNVSPRKEECAFEWWKEGEMVSMNNDFVRLAFSGTFGEVALKLKAIHRLSGCVAEKDTTIVSARQVRPELQLDFQEVCLGSPVKVTDLSVHGDQSEIDLGDGNATDETSVEHIYAEAGEYTIRLKVKNSGGCEGTVEKTVTVHPLPEAVFTWDFDRSITGLPDLTVNGDKANGGVRFTNLSRGVSDGGELKYKWYFGDGSPVVVEKSPAHLYPNNGSYDVVLQAFSPAGCVDSMNTVVTIDAVKGLFLPTAFAPAVEDEGVSLFLPKGIGLARYKIMVYDKWGTCVWMSDKLEDGQPAEGWDGTFKGSPLPGGLYKWKVSALFEDGEVRSDKDGLGYVLLIR